MSGWIKLHRSFWEHPRRKDPDWTIVWIYLYLHAAYRPTKALWDGKYIILQPGQIICSKYSIAKETGISASKAQRLLSCYESELLIEQQMTRVNRLITITSWDKTQESELQNELPMDYDWTTNELRPPSHSPYKVLDLYREERREEGKKEEAEDSLCPKSSILHHMSQQPVSHQLSGEEGEQTPKPQGPPDREKKPPASKPPPSEEGQRFAAWFRSLLPPDRDTTAADLRNWAQTYDDLLRLDGRTKAEITKVCQWARSDAYYGSGNFLSANKLRHKDKTGTKYYDVYLSCMKSEQEKKNGSGKFKSNGGIPTAAELAESEQRLVARMQQQR